MTTNEISIEELPGIGPATAEKLSDAGFSSIEAIAVASPSELANTAEIGESTAFKIIAAARRSADIGGFETGDAILERRKEVGRISLGCAEVDQMMGGGFETQAITEVYGEFGCGKTQIAHQIAVNVQLPVDRGGLDGSTIIIDTENTFRPDRITQMVNGLSKRYDDYFDPEDFLKNIHVARAYNSNHQMLLVETASELADSLKDTEKPVRLLIVDSLTAHFRAEYVGRGTLSDRQQKLNKHLHNIMRFGDLNNAAVFITNQVMSKP
ncbi:MAG: DNA repair and recombination protein RadA, partial [Methanosarcinales archaeon]|nr:DNA repair and recombination protein RadA [Methanosarcinales archaeon]